MSALKPQDTLSISQDLTSDWLSNILNVRIESDSFKCFPDANNSTSNSTSLSNIIRIKYQDVSKHEDCYLTAKIIPLSPTPDSDTVEVDPPSPSFQMDVVEINFYKSIVPKILQQVPELEPNLPTFVYGTVNGDDVSKMDKKYASILLVKDSCKQQEAQNQNQVHPQTVPPANQSKPTLEQFDQGLEFLAKFHFASTCIECSEKTPLTKLYPWVIDWPASSDSSSSIPKVEDCIKRFQAGFDALDKLLPEKNRYAFVDLKRNAGTILTKVMEAGKPYATFIHGNLWQENVFYDTTNDKTSIKVVNWQMMEYSDPMFDLATYILSCFPEDQLSILSVELTVLKYVEELNKLIEKKSGSDPDAEGASFKDKFKSRKEFHENLQFFSTYGFAYAFILLTMSCDSISIDSESLPKILNIFRFLHDDMDLPAFLWSII